MFIYYNMVDFYLDNFAPDIRSIKVAVKGEEFKGVGFLGDYLCE